MHALNMYTPPCTMQKRQRLEARLDQETQRGVIQSQRWFKKYMHELHRRRALQSQLMASLHTKFPLKKSLEAKTAESLKMRDYMKAQHKVSRLLDKQDTNSLVSIPMFLLRLQIC